jgi:hypothetical protein
VSKHRRLDVFLPFAGKTAFAVRRELRAQFNALRKDLRVRERQSIDRAVRGCNVVCCTATGAASKVRAWLLIV